MNSWGDQDSNRKQKVRLSTRGGGDVQKKSTGSTGGTNSGSFNQERLIANKIKGEENKKAISEFCINNVQHQPSFVATQKTEKEENHLKFVRQGEIISSIRASPESYGIIDESGKKNIELHSWLIDPDSHLKKKSPGTSLNTEEQYLLLPIQIKTEQTHYTSPIQYWFSSASSKIVHDKYQRPMLRVVYSRKFSSS